MWIAPFGTPTTLLQALKERNRHAQLSQGVQGPPQPGHVQRAALLSADLRTRVVQAAENHMVQVSAGCWRALCRALHALCNWMGAGCPPVIAADIIA